MFRRMKVMRTILFYFIFSCSCLYCQTPYLFKKDYDKKSSAAFMQKSNIIKLPNKGYAVCFENKTDTATPDTTKLTIVTFEPNGNPNWGLEIPLYYAYNGTPISLYLATDNTILLSYTIYTNTSDTINYNWYGDVVIFKIDLNGNLIWSKTYGNKFGDDICRNIFGNSNHIYICGNTYDTLYTSNAFLTEIDLNGNIIFSKNYTFPNVTTNSGVLNWGFVDYGAINNSNDILLTSNIQTWKYQYFYNLNSSGNINWTKRMQTSGDGGFGSELHFIKPLNDGSFLICGREDTITNGQWDIWLSKISSTGNLIFSKALGGTTWDEALWVEENYKNEIILLCEPESYLGGISQTAVYKFGTNGNLIWGNIYNSSNASYPFGATKNNEDSTYTIFGVNGSYDEVEEIFLLKIDDDGNAPCNYQPATFPILDFGVLENIIVTESPSFRSSDTTLIASPISVNSNLICDMGTYIEPTDTNKPCKLNYFIPNVFSPNSDNLNNLYKIEVDCYESYFISIYNRWGQKLFTSSSPEISWNGRTTSGKEVPEGTYYYIINIDDKVEKGFLTLLK